VRRDREEGERLPLPTVAQLSELQKFLATYAAAAPSGSPESALHEATPGVESIEVADPEPEPERAAPARAPVEDYDDLEAEEVISLLGSLEGDDLMALRAYEESSQGRSAVLRAIDGVLARREPAGTR
jgi:hypothetical protein